MTAAGMPGGPAAKSENFAGSFRRLLGLFGPQRGSMIAVALLAGGSVVLMVLGPKIVGKAVDVVYAGALALRLPPGQSKGDVVTQLRADGNDTLANMISAIDLVPGAGIDFARVGSILLLALAVYLVAMVLQYIQGLLLNGAVQRVMQRLRGEVEAKIHVLPLSYFDKQPRGELLSRVTNDIDNVGQSLTQALSQLLTSMLSVVGVVVMMLIVSPLLTLVAITIIPVALLALRVIMARSRTHFVDQWRHTGELNGQVEEAYSAHELVTVFGRKTDVEQQFQAKNDELTHSGFRAQFISSLVMPIMLFLGNVQYVLVAVVGALRVTTGALTLGDVIAFIQYSRQFTQPLAQVGSMVNLLQSGVASAERVFEILDSEPQPAEASGALTQPVRGRVEFDQVAFHYTPDRPLITNLNLVAEPGTTVAIVGPTGAGKTTLVNLIMRFYDVTGGVIRLDGVPITDVPRADLRATMGMVLQDTWLFEGTIDENIRYGNIEASAEAVSAAARATFVDRFVRALPEGYATVIDDDGAGVSAGERQLITIARAFLADPAILILDEATSSVDTRTEVLLQKAMAALRSNRTSFVIAHRLSTIRDADVIVVMEDGAIVEQGDHTELLAAGGAYARLYQAQFEGAVAD